jgi:hypothetical protein
MATCSREGFQSFGVASSLSTERTFRGRGRDGDWNTQDKAARVGIGLTLVFVQLLSEPQVDLFKTRLPYPVPPFYLPSSDRPRN